MQYLRPMADEGVINSLLKEVQSGTSVHAYLFEGDKGLFTCESAAYFAAALLCENQSGTPCGECASCIQAQSGNNPDIIRLSLADITSKKSVGADEIRDIISDAYTRPFKSAKKIYIIEDGDMLTPQAQNAMLKILEEPPSYVVFILCVTNAELLLQTVRSRSRSVKFAPATDEQLAAYVRRKYPHMASRAEFVAAFADGIYGRADSMCENEGLSIMREKALELVERLVGGSDEEAIFETCAVFEEYKGTKGAADNTGILLELMLSYLTDALRIVNGADNMLTNGDMRDRLFALCKKSSRGQLNFAAGRVLETKQMLARYVNFKAAVMRLATGLYYGE